MYKELSVGTFIFACILLFLSGYIAGLAQSVKKEPPQYVIDKK